VERRPRAGAEVAAQGREEIGLRVQTRDLVFVLVSEQREVVARNGIERLKK
jgi:hypothetical protein